MSASPSYFLLLLQTTHHCHCCYSTNYLRPITDDMKVLLHDVQQILHRHQYLQPFLLDFNHIQFSINGCKGALDSTCNIVQTGSHCDVKYSFSHQKGIYCCPTNNSQNINSIVAILTVGNSRVITFERVLWGGSKHTETDTVLETRYFILSHGSMFILHLTDERPALRDQKKDRLSYWRDRKSVV